MSPAAVSAASASVVAVVVAHNGARWLPRLSAALATTTTDVVGLAVVDTSSTDGTRELLVDAFGASAVVDAPPRTGFGGAVALGLESLPQQDDDDWVWLLHDDCAPAADALEQLLAVGKSDDRVGVVGCRIRSWPRGRRLLEVGVTVAGSGRRETGLEPGEYDQGQYDDVRDVLSVSSAGMLVRRRVWDQLGGFDRRLPMFRDDLDFCWRATAAGHRVVVAPGAVLFHAEAATREARRIDCARGSQHLVDRKAAIFTVLANCSGWVVLPMYLRLLLASLLRVGGYLLGKLPRAALDELTAAVVVLGAPWRIAAARRRVRRRVPRHAIRRLLPPWWTPYANGFDVVANRLGAAMRGTRVSVTSSARRLRSATGDPASLETGPVPEEAVSLPTGPGPLAWMAAHPALTLFGALVLAALVAGRGLWGGGFLQGGALLPAPDGASDWWRLYIQSHHAVGFGSWQQTAPYVALLGLLGGILVGKAWLAVDVLMLLAVPIAAVGGYLAAGRLVASTAARLWAATAYAVLVVVTGTVTTGHIGTVVAALTLPWLVLGAATIADPARTGWWRAGWGTGIALAVMTAFAPLAWPMAAAVAIAGSGLLLRLRLPARVGAVLVALGVPFALLMPWSFGVASHPTRLLDEAGVVDVPGPSVSGVGWHLLLGRLGAAGSAPLWLGVGVTLAALAALLRSDRRGRVAGAWVVAAVGLATAAVVSHQRVSPAGSVQQAHAWFGLPVVVAAAAMVAAAALGTDGLRAWMRASAFGWRQPFAAVTVVAALGMPLAALGWWLGLAPQGELHRADPVPLPAYMTLAMSTSAARVLVVDTSTNPVQYRILAGDGLRLGEETVLPDRPTPAVTSLVTRLLAQPRRADVARLAAVGIRFVVLPAPVAPKDVVNLDGTPGLQPASSVPRAFVGWRVEGAGLPPAGADPETGGHRTGWLAGQLGCWVLVLVMAAPSIRPRPAAVEETA